MLDLWKGSEDVAYLRSITDAPDCGPDEVRVMATLKRKAGYWYMYAGETEVGATFSVVKCGANARVLIEVVRLALVRHHQSSLKILV